VGGSVGKWDWEIVVLGDSGIFISPVHYARGTRNDEASLNSARYGQWERESVQSNFS